MDRRQPSGPSFWKYLIKDKRATEQLDQLCYGIAQVISKLEPGKDRELTPQRLANFYRTVGGNYDSLFLKTSDSGLSFMYKTLGCFHSLQPTFSPFETPQLPCLTPAGFARWITIQILLCPEENVDFLQSAVRIWDIPGPNGTVFPKYIPKDVFPTKPDDEMEQWHKNVTGQLNQQKYLRRIKNSPFQSPHPEPHDPRDGYFSTTQTGRSSRPSRSSSRDDQDHMAALYRRRSSVPDFPSPQGDRGSHWDARAQEDARKTRSHSASRPALPPTRQRSHTTTGSPNQSKQPTRTPPKSPSSRRQPDQSARPNSGYNGPYRSPARTPSTVDEDTGSEASSENSQANRRPRKSDEDRKSRRNSLWPPAFMRSHKRRHSSDASYRGASKHTQPLRPEYYSSRSNKGQASLLKQPDYYGSRPPQFRDTNWDSDPSHQNGTGSNHGLGYNEHRAPPIRYPDQSDYYPLSRENSSGSGTDHRHRSSDQEPNGHRRHANVPARLATVSGVQGRRYPDALSPIERHRGPNPL